MASSTSVILFGCAIVVALIQNAAVVQGFYHWNDEGNKKIYNIYQRAQSFMELPLQKTRRGEQTFAQVDKYPDHLRKQSFAKPKNFVEQTQKITKGCQRPDSILFFMAIGPNDGDALVKQNEVAIMISQLLDQYVPDAKVTAQFDNGSSTLNISRHVLKLKMSITRFMQDFTAKKTAQTVIKKAFSLRVSMIRSMVENTSEEATKLLIWQDIGDTSTPFHNQGEFKALRSVPNLQILPIIDKGNGAYREFISRSIFGDNNAKDNPVRDSEAYIQNPKLIKKLLCIEPENVSNSSEVPKRAAQTSSSPANVAEEQTSTMWAAYAGGAIGVAVLAGGAGTFLWLRKRNKKIRDASLDNNEAIQEDPVLDHETDSVLSKEEKVVAASAHFA